MNCKVSKLCGGCPYLGMGIAKQAELKKQNVENLARINHLKVTVGDVHTARLNKKYRNKIIVGFAKDKGVVRAGLYAAKSHRVVYNENCPMHPDIVNQVIGKITELVQSMKIELYNPKNGTGLLRHVLIRWGHATDEMMVVFVTGKNQFPSRRNLVNELVKQFPQIKTILQNVNPRNTSIVLENETFILYGKGYIEDILLGKKYMFTPSSFYQIHSEQCEVLYKLAIDMAGIEKTDTVLDTYCGVGTIGLSVADYCKQVVGVEINPEAIECARRNASANHISNARFIAMDSTKYMAEAIRQKNHYDIIILDPPRAGTTHAFIDNACRMNPKKIVYISCDPKTLTRDLNSFKLNDYYTDRIELVDMFPNTDKIEAVCVLKQRKKPAPKRH